MIDYPVATDLKVGIYARESSDDTNKAPPISDQIARAEQYAKENNFKIFKVYADNGYSGGDWNRPQWRQLVKDTKRHCFSLVIIWNSDRIARDVEQFLWFNRNLKKANVGIYSITEGQIETDSVGSTAKNISIAMANEIFRKVTSEKVKRAYEMTKRKSEAKGVKLKWGREAGNYDTDLIFELRTQGLGYRAIAKKLKKGSYQTVRRVLQNTPQKNSLPYT